MPQTRTQIKNGYQLTVIRVPRSESDSSKVPLSDN